MPFTRHMPMFRPSKYFNLGSRGDTVRFIHAKWTKFIQAEDGVTAIEYSLIAAILGVALVPVLGNTTSGVASLYTRVQGYFDIVNGT